MYNNNLYKIFLYTGYHMAIAITFKWYLPYKYEFMLLVQKNYTINYILQYKIYNILYTDIYYIVQQEWYNNSKRISLMQYKILWSLFE